MRLECLEKTPKLFLFFPAIQGFWEAFYIDHKIYPILHLSVQNFM